MTRAVVHCGPVGFRGQCGMTGAVIFGLFLPRVSLRRALGILPSRPPAGRPALARAVVRPRGVAPVAFALGSHEALDVLRGQGVS